MLMFLLLIKFVVVVTTFVLLGKTQMRANSSKFIFMKDLYLFYLSILSVK
jgi:hypothetical protein